MTLPAVKADNALTSTDDQREYITLFIAGQMFGIPVLMVQDVLKPQRITKIPLASPEIAGALNLRGRIVTAIDLRIRLNMPPIEGDGMSIVVEHNGELYSLLVDAVGEVLSCAAKSSESVPPTLEGTWREVSECIYRLDGKLMIVFDIARLLNFTDMLDAQEG